MKVLITGITGMVGSHLAEYILENHPEVSVHGLIRWRSPLDNIRDIQPQITLHQAELRDLNSLVLLLRKVKPDWIFHLAAQSYVSTSFNAPADTIHTNVIGTTNLLDAVRITEIDPKIHICSCYDEQTEVLTQRGFLSYDQVMQDDLVVSIDPVAQNVDYKTISKVVVQNYEGTMLRVKTRSIDLLVTPNHKLLFSRASTRDKLIFEETQRIHGLQRCYFPKGRHKGAKAEKIWVGSSFYRTEDIFYLIGLYLGDGYSDHHISRKRSKTGLSRNEFLSTCRDKKGRFVARPATAERETLCHCDRIFLAIPKGDKARKDAVACLQRLGLQYKEYEKELYFSSTDFRIFLDKLGHSAHTKTIPEWVFSYDAYYLGFLYKGLIDSDGYYHATGERFTTVSQGLATALTKLCLFTGRFVTMREIESATAVLNGRLIRTGRAYQFSVSNKSRMIQGKNLVPTYYKGKVWCLKVPETHNFVVRRNGKICFCGNSSEVYGQVTKDEIPIRETNPFRPASPYAVSKVGEDMIGLQYFLSYGIKTIRTRMFTHTGPRRGDIFSESAFAKQISEIEAGVRLNPMKVGNLNSVRTFADVRDAVRAYWLLLEKCPPGEVYNIGGNRTMTVAEMLEILKQIARCKVEHEVDPALLRPSDVTLQIPDTSKFRTATGWEPEIPLEVTLRDLLEYHRNRIQNRRFLSA